MLISLQDTIYHESTHIHPIQYMYAYKLLNENFWKAEPIKIDEVITDPLLPMNSDIKSYNKSKNTSNRIK